MLGYDRELIKFLDRLEDESESFHKEERNSWDRLFDLYRGKGWWPEKRPSYKLSTVVNHISRIIERKVAYMTDSRIIMQILPRRDEKLADCAKILEETISAIYEEQALDLVLTEMLYIAQIVGGVFSNTMFDPSLDDGMGDITVVCGDPRVYKVDPFVLRSYDVGQKAEYIISESCPPTSMLWQQFPEFKEVIKPTFTAKDDKADDGKSFTSKVMEIFRGKKQHEATKYAIDRTLKKEYWIRDRTEEEKEEEDETTYERRKRNLPKYPGGRHIIRCGNIIVVDGPNPYWDGRFPIDMVSWHFDPTSPFGYGEVESLKSMQETYNKIAAVIVENALMLSNGIWVMDEEAVENPESLVNKPGARIVKRQGSDVHREPGIPLPPHLFNLETYLETQMEKTSGMVDVTQGKRPEQVTSGIAIEGLQLAAQATVRLKARSIENLIQQVGQKLISRIFQFYNSDRLLYIFGDNEKYRAYRFVRSELINKYGQGNNIEKAFRDFVFKVVPGSSLAMAKIQKIMFAITLANMGRITNENLLEVIEWPNKEKVLRDLEEERAKGNVPPVKRAKVPSILGKGRDKGGIAAI
jgi:hypothetical protein